MKKALVCGAGGFIASHLVKRLKHEGYWVRAADQKLPEFSPTAADEFLQIDLRERDASLTALKLSSGEFDEVYQLEGGILNYLEETPADETLWEGECFVFDERISVGSDLRKGHVPDHSQRFAKRKKIQYKPPE